MYRTKFRIINLKTNKWIYFVMKDLLTKPNLFSNVDWKTFGQSLGKNYKDNNQKDIYSDDYVKIVTFFCSDREEARKYSDRFNVRGCISRCDAGFQFMTIDLVDKCPDVKYGILGSDLFLTILGANAGGDMELDQIDSNDLEIIGNRHDTPELNKITV